MSDLLAFAIWRLPLPNLLFCLPGDWSVLLSVFPWMAANVSYLHLLLLARNFSLLWILGSIITCPKTRQMECHLECCTKKVLYGLCSVT